jgi:hypothetical protein
MSEEKMSPSVADILRYAIARQQGEAVSSYISRGRAHMRTINSVLADQFVDTMRRWASDTKDVHNRERIADLMSEYTLRSQQRPLYLVRDEWAKLRASIAELIRTWDGDRKCQIDDALWREYQRARKRES